MTTQKHPSTSVKVLAIAGFVVVIGFLLWLAVTLVTALPSAFSSLASIAEGIQQNRPATTMTVANANSIVNNGEGFAISWTDINRAGVYTLAYTCTDGVAVDMRYPANNITSVPCGETIRLGSDVTSLELIARSEKKRFIDIDYTIGFIPNGADAVAYSTDSSFTVVNVNIPQSQSIATTDTEADDTEPTGEVAGETTDDTVEEPSTPVTPGEPTVVATEIFELPSSDPDGFVDLAIKYLGTGRLTNDNEFIPGGTIDSDSRGAFQFEVRNLGTKTSDEWSFEAALPTGREFASDEQDGLLPNEYSVITLGFDLTGETGAQTFGAEIDVDDDRVAGNNDFTWAVTITD